MARTLKPITPDKYDWRKYNRTLHQVVLFPLIKELNKRIVRAERDYKSVQKAIKNIKADPSMAGLTGAAAKTQAAKLLKQHNAEFERTMKEHLGIRYRITDNYRVDQLMQKFIKDNVSLVKTIPPRLHAALERDIIKLQQKGPFDQKALSDTLSKNYNSAGYNLRRLTRDQTSKAVGNLNHIRQTDAGLTEYIWRTSMDERVRSSHRVLRGRRFKWSSPPPEGHPGHPIQCRCYAEGVMPPIREVKKRQARIVAQRPQPTGKTFLTPSKPPPVPKPLPQPATPSFKVDPLVTRLNLKKHNNDRVDEYTKDMRLDIKDFERELENLKEERLTFSIKKEINDLNEKISETKDKIKRYDDLKDPLKIVSKEINVSKEVLEKTLKETFDEKNVSQYMAIKIEKITDAIKENKLKSSIETGEGAFGTIGKARFDKTEKPVFNLKDSDVEKGNYDNMPKYGFIDEPNRITEIGVDGYGDIYIKLKPKVRERSTVTLGDSMNSNDSHTINVYKQAPAVPLNNVDGTIARGFMKSDSDSAENWVKTKNHNDLRYSTIGGGEYTETQIFGKLTFKDVESIMVDSLKQKKRLEKILKENNMDIPVISSGKNAKLQRIMQGDARPLSELSHKDIDLLGDSYIEKMLSADDNHGMPFKFLIQSITFGDRIPKKLKGLVDQIFESGVKSSPISLKRAYVREFYKMMYEDADNRGSIMPKDFSVIYYKSKTGWTEDVIDKELLKKYPE